MNESGNWEDKYRNEMRSDDELMALVLTKDPDDADDEYWRSMGSLQHRLSSIWARVEELLRSGNERSREAAATILGQNRCSSKWAVTRCVDLLLTAISHEPAVPVRVAILHALGHLHDERSVPVIATFQTHESSDVRYALTHALSGFENQPAIEALIELSGDSDDEVRNWATFNLGSQIDTDTPRIRDALAARLKEADDEILGEPIVGLARRGDPRFTPSLMRLFDQNAAGVLRNWALAQEAVDAVIERAVAAPEASWLPILLRAQELGIGDQARIQAVIEKCNPTGTVEEP